MGALSINLRAYLTNLISPGMTAITNDVNATSAATAAAAAKMSGALNGAVSPIDTLKAKADGLRQELARMEKADPIGFAKNIESHKAEIDKIDKALAMQGSVKSRKDLKKELSDLQRQFHATADPKRQEELAAKIRETDAELKKMNATLRAMPDVGGGGKFAQFKQSLGEAAREIPGVGSAIGFLTNPIGAAITGLTGLGYSFVDSFKTGMKFEDALADLSAITGISGSGLNAMGDSAKKMAADFGGTAVDAISSYKNILSVLGPDLAKNPQALDNMGRHVQTLSKTMGGDAVGAANALTGAMSQYSVDLSDPIKASEEMGKMMDVMAAGAQVGAAEVPQIADSVKVAGGMAKEAGVSFAELNGGIQVLATKGIKGAEAGTALRNVMIKLNEGRFLPKETAEQLKAAGVDIKSLGDKSVPLATRLSQLTKIQKDSALVAKLFGAENVVAGSALLANIPMLEEFTTAVSKPGAAQAQASVYMNTFSERFSRISAQFENFKIGVFEAAAPYVAGAMDAVGNAFNWASANAQTFKAVLTPIGIGIAAAAGAFLLYKGVLIGAGLAQSAYAVVTNGTAIATGLATTAQWALNAAMSANPVGVVIAGIGILAGGMYWLYENVEQVRFGFAGLWAAAGAVASNIYNAFAQLVGGVVDIFTGLFTMDWTKLKDGVGNALKGALKTQDPFGVFSGESVVDAAQKGYADKQAQEAADKKKEAKTAAKPTAGGAANLTQSAGGAAMAAKANDPAAAANIKTEPGKSTNITINVNKLVEKLEVHAANLTEGTQQVQDSLTRTLLDILNDSTAIAGQ